MSHPMTRPDDAASVKLLREFAQSMADLADDNPCWTRIRIQAREALAATAPPKPYSAKCDRVYWDREGASSAIIRFHSEATPAQRAAVLDALNALAEKEATNG